MKYISISGGYGRNGLAADKALERLQERMNLVDMDIRSAHVRVESDGEDNIVDISVWVPDNMTIGMLRERFNLRAPRWTVEID